MNKLALFLGLSVLATSALHCESPKQVTFEQPSTKITSDNLASSLKKLMKDCPEFSAIIKGVKTVVSNMKKDAIVSHKSCSLSMVIQYESTVFEEIKTAQALKSLGQLNEMPGITMASNDADNNMTITIVLDQGIVDNFGSESGEDVGEKDVMPESAVASIVSMLEKWSNRVDEAIAALNKVTTIDPFSAEQMLQIFGIFEIYTIVDQLTAALVNDAQLQLCRNCKSINVSLLDQNNNVVAAVTKEVNALFEQLIALRSKVETNVMLVNTLQQTAEALVKVVTDYQDQIVF